VTGSNIAGRLASRPAIVGIAALLLAGCGGHSTAAPPQHGAGRAPAHGTRPGVDPAAARRLQGTLDRVRREQGIPGAAAAVASGWRGCGRGRCGRLVEMLEPVRLNLLRIIRRPRSPGG
jgi:hypothetical protein